MDRIHYAGTTTMTGTAIARALVDYAQALARNESSATIEVPVRNPDGTAGVSHFLLGPASELVSDTLEADGAELIDDEAIARIQSATRALDDDKPHPVVAEPYTPESAADLDAADDFF